jgi:flavin-dependent dehydrogenase
MICGDAAWFPNPISAGGIGPGLIGGVMAGETAVRAIEANDFSEKQLWQYNLDFVNHYGNKTAGLEVFRMYLQTLNNDQINYGMRHFLSSDEATEISLGEMPHLSAGKKIVKLFRGLGSYKAFSGLVFTMSRMRALNELYQNYPKDPAQFDAWKANVDSILAQGRARFH